MTIQNKPLQFLPVLISLACITIILSGACNSHPPIPVTAIPEQSLTSIRTDSFIAYTFHKKGVPYMHEFIFSPFEKNKVWVMYQVDESFELDLESGQQTSFSQKFGQDFFKKWYQKTANIIPDPQDTSVCWFFNNGGGVFRYDYASHQGQLFNIANGQRSILCLSFYAGQVFIGTSNGLWWYERSTGQCRPVDYSPEINIGRMVFYPPGKIMTGSHYAYDVYNKCWEFSENHPADIQEESHYPEHYSFPLPTFGTSYLFGADTNEIWAFNDKYWVAYNRAGRSSKIYKPVFPDTPAVIRIDHLNIYLLYPDRFVVVSKAFIREKQSGDQALIQKFMRLEHLADSLHSAEKEDYTVRKAKMAFLKQQFQGETDAGLLNALNTFLLRFFEFTDETNLKRLIADIEIDTSIKKNLYSRLLDVQIRSGKLHAGLESFQNYKKEFPQSDFFQKEYTQRSWQAIEKNIKKIDSLDHIGLTPDELLWAKGHVVYDLCRNYSYFEGEGCNDVTLADSIYKIITRKFPASPRAEEADYALINNRCHACEDGSNNPEEIVIWKKFLTKYPNALKKSQILGAMAWALNREEADLVQGLRWLEEAILLSNDPALLQSMKDEFQGQLDMLKMLVTISLKKSKVRTGEPVEVVFKAQNTGSHPIKIPVISSAAYPSFLVEVQFDAAGVSCVKPMVFRESKLLSSPQKESDWKEKTLKPAEIYQEIWDITQTARKYNDIYLGGYVFDQPGKYQIQARCLMGQIQKESKPVWVVVE